MTDRETLEAVAKGYHEIIGQHKEERRLIAKLMRACIQNLSSRDAKIRCDAVKALGLAADLLEDYNDRGRTAQTPVG